MFADPGAPMGARDVQQWRVAGSVVEASASPEVVLGAIHAPHAIVVRTEANGCPIAIQRPDRPRVYRVVAVQDRWRIDDEWWRERPISRLYHRVLVEGDVDLTLYHDLIDGQWYEQRYGDWQIPVRRFRTHQQSAQRPLKRSAQPGRLPPHSDPPRIPTRP